MKIRFQYALWRAFAFLLLATSSGVARPESERLTGCASHTPPFMMFSQEQPSGGFSYELLQYVSTQMGRHLIVNQLPWARCLQEVKYGRIDLAIDAYDDLERHKSFHYSKSYHTLTPQLFYRANTLMDAMNIRSVDDLERFKGCGVHDYTYEHYDLDVSKMDSSAADDNRMLQKLVAGHCDYALEELEYITGGRTYVPGWLDESQLKSMRPPWAKGPKIHFLIGRANSGGEELLKKIDSAIVKAEKSGLATGLRKKYFDMSKKSLKIKN
jgi:polar amino acid transport system substrate-binding protein